MAIVYATICSWAVVLRKFAAWKHNRLKKAYDLADSTFRTVEQECKSHEVTIGSPADYHSQMKLLRLFDSTEQARQRWVRSGTKLKKRKQRERFLRKFNGRKLPYSFGLLDMALVFKLVDAGREFGNWDFGQLLQTVQHWI